MLKCFLQLLLFISVVDISAQKNIYLHDSETNDPLPYVNVQAGNFSGVSSPAGLIRITAKDDDTVKFSCVGYTTLKIVNSLLRHEQTIVLKPAVIFTETVLVTDNKTPSNTFKEKIDIPKNAGEIYKSAGDLLRIQSTLFVKDYGNASSSKTVSFRGMSSENVIVLFNEARINDLRSGFFDFNSISINNIEQFDIIKGAEQDNSFSGSGGIVKIKTGNFQEKTGLKLSARYGLENLQSYYGKLQGSAGQIYYSAFAERSFSPNEFKYEFEDIENKRSSAAFNKSIAGLDLKYTLNKYILKNYFHYSYLNSGIPGSVVSNNDGTNKLNNASKAFVNILNFDFPVSSSLYSKNTIAANINYFKITDPDQVLFYPAKDRTSKLNEFQLLNNLSYNYKQASFSAGNFLISSDLSDNSNMNTIFKKPDTYNRVLDKIHLSAAYLDTGTYILIKNINYFAWGSHTYLKEKTDTEITDNFSTYKFGISFQVNSSQYLKFISSYSNDSREPSYSERFYSELYRYGSSILRNESYRWFDLGLETRINFLGNTNISVVYFEINADDKIIWVPVATLPGLQVPKNMGKIKSTGIEFTLKKNISKELSITANYVYNKALNKNNFFNNDHSYNKQLIYAPKERFNYSITYSPLDVLTLNFMGYYSGTSYYTSDNNPRYSLKSYFINDFSVFYLFKNRFANFQAGLNIYNFSNETYFIIQSYPMPVRNYSFTLTMEIK